MAQTRKYKVGCSGRGWGVWEIAMCNKKATLLSGFLVAHCRADAVKDERNDAAAERYIRSLSGYYKYCAKNKPEMCRQIAADIQKVAAGTGRLGRNMTITVLLIRFCPWLYRLVHAVHTKLRKPQWEARKD